MCGHFGNDGLQIHNLTQKRFEVLFQALPNMCLKFYILILFHIKLVLT